MTSVCLFLLLVQFSECCKINKDSFWVFLKIFVCWFVFEILSFLLLTEESSGFKTEFDKQTYRNHKKNSKAVFIYFTAFWEVYKHKMTNKLWKNSKAVFSYFTASWEVYKQKWQKYMINWVVIITQVEITSNNYQVLEMLPLLFQQLIDYPLHHQKSWHYWHALTIYQSHYHNSGIYERKQKIFLSIRDIVTATLIQLSFLFNRTQTTPGPSQNMDDITLGAELPLAMNALC